MQKRDAVDISAVVAYDSAFASKDQNVVVWESEFENDAIAGADGLVGSDTEVHAFSSIDAFVYNGHR